MTLYIAGERIATADGRTGEWIVDLACQGRRTITVRNRYYRIFFTGTAVLGELGSDLRAEQRREIAASLRQSRDSVCPWLRKYILESFIREKEERLIAAIVSWLMTANAKARQHN